jgi:hypothetical protein
MSVKLFAIRFYGDLVVLMKSNEKTRKRFEDMSSISSSIKDYFSNKRLEREAVQQTGNETLTIYISSQSKVSKAVPMRFRCRSSRSHQMQM